MEFSSGLVLATSVEKNLRTWQVLVSFFVWHDDVEERGEARSCDAQIANYSVFEQDTICGAHVGGYS